jgi:hypothetical protein
MVVVLVMVARAAKPAGVAEAIFGANGRAANIMEHCNARQSAVICFGIRRLSTRNKPTAERLAYWWVVADG